MGERKKAGAKRTGRFAVLWFADQYMPPVGIWNGFSAIYCSKNIVISMACGFLRPVFALLKKPSKVA